MKITIKLCLILLATLSLTAQDLIPKNSLKPILVGKKISSKTSKITMDLDTLKNSNNFKNRQPIAIEIVEGKTLTFIPKRLQTRKEEGGFSWVGKSEDGKAKAILSVRNGVMVGTVTCKDGKYKLYPENTHYKVTKVDPNMAIPFHDDTIVQESEASSDEPQESDDEVQASEASSTDSIVTLLVYYTQALEDKYGVNTQAMIQANLDLAKDAYIDSDTEINLQVVMLKKVPVGTSLSRANPDDLNDLLNNLRLDGLVRYERELYGADAVTVFSRYPDSGYCGLGQTTYYDLSSLVDAYSSVHIKPSSEYGYYCPDLTFAHELGHNFGCQHDSENADGAMYDYAYGYDVADGGTDNYGNPTYHFATIMSYDSPGISFFSNPDINDSTSGIAIGDASTADNARTIRENKYKMADNSEQISEALESGDGDTIVDYAVSGYLNSSTDRDGYVMWLEGTTTLDKSNHSFYMNIYNEDTHQHVISSDEDTVRIFTKGRYRVVVAMNNDETGRYKLSDDTVYSIDILTEYIPPVFNPAIPSIINYLLN